MHINYLTDEITNYGFKKKICLELRNIENFAFTRFVKNARRRNCIFESKIEGITTLYVVSSLASKHKYSCLIKFPKDTHSNIIAQIINLLKGVNLYAESTTWSISKNTIRNSEKDSFKQMLAKNNINVEFSLKIIQTPRYLIKYIFDAKGYSNKNKTNKTNKTSKDTKMNEIILATNKKKTTKLNLAYEQLSMFN